MITALKQVEAGRAVEDVAREYGVSKHTIYAWKAKYGGMDVSEAEEVKHLRDENSRCLRKKSRKMWVMISYTELDGICGQVSASSISTPADRSWFSRTTADV